MTTFSSVLSDHWKTGRGSAAVPAPFLVCGIVNVTPDSFYDGGTHAGTQSAVEHAQKLISEGAGLLDIGGESSRPNAAPVSEADEFARVVPVVSTLHALRAGMSSSDYPWRISVDTYKAKTAAAALGAGADIINDISACAFEPALLDVVAQYKPGYVLMHSQGKPDTMQKAPHYDNVVDEIYAFFEREMSRLVRAGLPEENIVLDPGIGFGKLPEHNVAIIQNIRRFSSLGRPSMGALSNKSLFGALLGLAPHERQHATQIATALLASRGVAIHRVHEVAPTVQTLRLAAALAEVKGGEKKIK